MSPVRIRQGLQFMIGVLLVASAIAKVLDVAGFAQVLETYKAFPETILFPLALTVTLLSYVLVGGFCGAINFKKGH